MSSSHVCCVEHLLGLCGSQVCSCRPKEKQTYTLSHGGYQTSSPLAAREEIFGSSLEIQVTLPHHYCKWTASLDRRGIEWRDDHRVEQGWLLPLVCKSPFHGTACPCESCTAALQYTDYVTTQAEVEWLQFLVRPLLLEQWGLEAEGEIWFQGMVCLEHDPCLALPTCELQFCLRTTHTPELDKIAPSCFRLVVSLTVCCP